MKVYVGYIYEYEEWHIITVADSLETALFRTIEANCTAADYNCGHAPLLNFEIIEGDTEDPRPFEEQAKAYNFECTYGEDTNKQREKLLEGDSYYCPVVLHAYVYSDGWAKEDWEKDEAQITELVIKSDTTDYADKLARLTFALWKQYNT